MSIAIYLKKNSTWQYRQSTYSNSSWLGSDPNLRRSEDFAVKMGLEAWTYVSRRSFHEKESNVEICGGDICGENEHI